jgi:hypothetical protein
LSDREHHAEAGPDRANGPNRQRKPTSSQRVDVASDLVAHDRQVRERRVQHVVLEVRIAVQQESEDRDERQQQWKHREERPIGDDHSGAVSSILRELQGDGYREGGDDVTLLEAVKPDECGAYADARS